MAQTQIQTQIQTQTNNKVVINFSAEADSIILNSPLFISLNVTKNSENYYVIIENDYLDLIEMQIKRNGGTIIT